MILIQLMPVFAGTTGGLVALLAFASLLAPRLSRPDIFFSITVGPSLRESLPGRKILRDFSHSVIFASALGMALVLAGVFAGLNPVLSILLVSVAWLAQLAGILKSYATARRRVIPYRAAPSTEREAMVGPHRPFTAAAWLGQSGPFLILGLTCLWLWWHWDAIPEGFPVHWGWDGRPNGWGTRSIGDIFLLPIIGAIVCLFLTILTQSLARGVRRIHSTGPEAQKEARNLRNMLRVLLGVEYWLALMFGAMSFLPFVAESHGPLSPTLLLVIVPVSMSFILVVATILIAVKSGQGGWRLAGGRQPKPATDKTAPVGDRTPDACWKAGFIYYNPDDPAVWVEKRFGVGWTINMGNRGGKLVLVAILLFGLVIPLLSVFLLRK